MLIRGDSAEILPIEGVRIHLVCTSPPYLADMEGDIYPDLDSYRAAMRAVMAGCFEMLIDGGVICWNILNHGGMNLTAKAAFDLEEVGFRFWRSITWEKADNLGVGFTHTMKRPFALNWIPNCITESLLIYIKGRKRRAYPQYPLNLALARKFRTDIWHMDPVVKIGADGVNRLGHDSPFPIQLAVNCIEFFTLPGEIVLDPFVGSGTSLYACAQVEPARRGIGIEILDKHIQTCIRELQGKGQTLWGWALNQGVK